VRQWPVACGGQLQLCPELARAAELYNQQTIRGNTLVSYVVYMMAYVCDHTNFYSRSQRYAKKELCSRSNRERERERERTQQSKQSV
jgi:hypothetical protein